MNDQQEPEQLLEVLMEQAMETAPDDDEGFRDSLRAVVEQVLTDNPGLLSSDLLLWLAAESIQTSQHRRLMRDNLLEVLGHKLSRAVLTNFDEMGGLREDICHSSMDLEPEPMDLRPHPHRFNSYLRRKCLGRGSMEKPVIFEGEVLDVMAETPPPEVTTENSEKDAVINKSLLDFYERCKKGDHWAYFMMVVLNFKIPDLLLEEHTSSPGQVARMPFLLMVDSTEDLPALNDSLVQCEYVDLHYPHPPQSETQTDLVDTRRLEIYNIDIRDLEVYPEIIAWYRKMYRLMIKRCVISEERELYNCISAEGFDEAMEGKVPITGIPGSGKTSFSATLDKRTEGIALIHPRSISGEDGSRAPLRTDRFYGLKRSGFGGPDQYRTVRVGSLKRVKIGPGKPVQEIERLLNSLQTGLVETTGVEGHNLPKPLKKLSLGFNKGLPYIPGFLLQSMTRNDERYPFTGVCIRDPAVGRIIKALQNTRTETSGGGNSNLTNIRGLMQLWYALGEPDRLSFERFILSLTPVSHPLFISSHQPERIPGEAKHLDSTRDTHLGSFLEILRLLGLIQIYKQEVGVDRQIKPIPRDLTRKDARREDTAIRRIFANRRRVKGQGLGPLYEALKALPVSTGQMGHSSLLCLLASLITVLELDIATQVSNKNS